MLVFFTSNIIKKYTTFFSISESMSDFHLIVAGSLGIIASLFHNYIGYKEIVGKANTTSRAAKRLLHAIWFLSGVYWFLASLALILIPYYVEDTLLRKIFILISIVILFIPGKKKFSTFLFYLMLKQNVTITDSFLKGILNIIAMEGTHPGGYLLILICFLAFLGL